MDQVKVKNNNTFFLILEVIINNKDSVCVPLFGCRRFDRAVEEWRQFHCDLNDLSQWLTDTETLLSESVGPDGQLDLNSARQHQQVNMWPVIVCFT